MKEAYNLALETAAETITKHHDEDMVDPNIILDLKIK